MRILNDQVYGLQEALIRSGYPMRTEVGVFDLNDAAASLKRGKALANTPIGSGHDNWLVGVVVQMDIEAPSYWWPEFQRYHFADIISSQSKMHRITKMDLTKQCVERVDKRQIAVAEEYIAKYLADPHDDAFEDILANLPMGLQLTAGITTNYRQLKTMCAQRENHRQEMWREVFVPWAHSLPFFKQWCVEGEDE